MSNENTQARNTENPEEKPGFWEAHGKKVLLGTGAVALGVAAGLATYAVRNTGVGGIVEDLAESAAES